MYRLINKLTGVLRIEKLIPGLLLLKSNGFYYYNKNYEVSWVIDFVESHFPVTKYFEIEDESLISIDTMVNKIDFENGRLKKVFDLSFYPFFYENNCFIGHRFGKIYAYSLTKKDVIFEIKSTGGYYDINRNSIYEISFPENDSIKFYSINNGRELWKLNLNQLLPVEKILQSGKFISHNDKLYFYLYEFMNTQNSFLFCINETTGEVLHKIENFGGDMYLLDDLIYSVFKTTIRVLDTNTMEVKIIEFEDEFKKHDFRFSSNRSVITAEGLIYFIDGSVFPTNRFGIADINKVSLLWHSEINVNDGVNNCINNIHVHKDKLYLHASDDSVHILEK